MPVDKTLKKVMIIGSGPIIIGQAAEFDYSGTQACKAIREEGIETVLVNSNPATIMTDMNMADKVYIEPLNIKILEKIIEREKPDGILAGFGGQTALNLAMDLKTSGILEKNNVRLLGIHESAIHMAEDREAFKKLMLQIGEPVPKSIIATTLEECKTFVKEAGFPVIIRPAYTLGGTGGGIAKNEEELIDLCKKGISSSPIGQILLEQSVAGWKEIEYEVMRDKKDNCIVICNMENIDPVGIHTGDSIVAAPSQTLRDKEYQMLRKAAIKIIRSLKIEGGCNIQFALDPKSEKYVVIEVNPRVSRSSALASKAAGYPIAKIAAKIAIGYCLDELKNDVTKSTSACFEPALDYVVVKIPKWPFDKFQNGKRSLGTQMKATGEVMAIDRTFESALLKAITSLEGKIFGLRLEKLSTLTKEELLNKIDKHDDERIFAIAEALRKGISIEKLHEITKIDNWFLHGIQRIIHMERRLQEEELNAPLLKEAKKLGFTDREILFLTGIDKKQLNKIKKEYNIYPVYKIVDTCGGEFDAKTPYYYSCYEEENENNISSGKKIVVIGSGPIRIGQGIEFDYCSVHGIWAIKKAGYESIIINNNPETVSTDFDTSDKLYFESLNIENVMNVIEQEKPEGVIVQYGGQTAINLAKELEENGVRLLGTSFHSIDLAEDRDKFRSFLEALGIKTPAGMAVKNIEEGIYAADKLGFPVVVRPSYVIGGRAMEVVYDREKLIQYMKEAINYSSEHPILIDQYIKGKEIEVDAISDGDDVLIPGIMEHIERSGIHSGDSITVYPARSLKQETVNELVEATRKIARGLNIKGLINIQFVYNGKDLYIIEVNPRASRTVPVLSKVTGVPIIQIATQVILGDRLCEILPNTGLIENKDLYAVKVPVFSHEKLQEVDVYLGPEMKSTGEVLGIDKEYDKALYKGFIAAGFNIPTSGNIYVSLKEVDRKEGLKVIKDYIGKGFKIYCSEGTWKFLKDNNIPSEALSFQHAMEAIEKGKIQAVLNIPTKGNDTERKGFKIRRKALEYRIPLFTCLDTVRQFLKAIIVKQRQEEIHVLSLKEYYL
ncbi:carbamoyl-phosphate synthase (glutamine-hydrolyzing) large subunit [Fonticella tunisiensis]|uniref:Carbamoyl phosphate synthase large chain n=1 Tax=Fonticella tunisiensis TaxID=1096341 RepID=A0A4R7KTR3_9CLOT|nr:carbamoyl-phosphate synthase (glutamine-hydrolyzing) large subunit [Fonticella tunisiensis]TDT62833.1 carbamoyl-phosphate synthase large subunit [Fonticella tunisiensis]